MPFEFTNLQLPSMSFHQLQLGLTEGFAHGASRDGGGAATKSDRRPGLDRPGRYISNPTGSAALVSGSAGDFIVWPVWWTDVTVGARTRRHGPHAMVSLHSAHPGRALRRCGVTMIRPAPVAGGGSPTALKAELALWRWAGGSTGRASCRMRASTKATARSVLLNIYYVVVIFLVGGFSLVWVLQGPEARHARESVKRSAAAPLAAKEAQCALRALAPKNNNSQRGGVVLGH